MPQYRHDFALHISIVSEQKDAEDISPDTFLEALTNRIRYMDGQEAQEACWPPISSEEV